MRALVSKLALRHVPAVYIGVSSPTTGNTSAASASPGAVIGVAALFSCHRRCSRFRWLVIRFLSCGRQWLLCLALFCLGRGLGNFGFIRVLGLGLWLGALCHEYCVKLGGVRGNVLECRQYIRTKSGCAVRAVWMGPRSPLRLGLGKGYSGEKGVSAGRAS